MRGETEELESVTIKLHPTFKDPVRVCEQPPFEFHARGNGVDGRIRMRWDQGMIKVLKMQGQIWNWLGTVRKIMQMHHFRQYQRYSYREVTLMKASQVLRFLPLHFEGWGTFDITVLLKWKSGSVQRTTWELQFDQSDAFQELQIPAKVVQPAIPGCPAPPPPASETVQQVPVPPWEAENSDVFGVRGSIGLDSEDDVPMPPPAPPAEDTPGPPPELLRVESLVNEHRTDPYSIVG